jgi:hypothetical protein
VVHSDGKISLDDRPIIEEGAGITTSINVGDTPFELYRYTLIGLHGPSYGYIASASVPGAHARRAAAHILFGPGAGGIEQVEPVRGPR